MSACTCEELREFDWQNDSFLQGVLCTLQPRHVIPLHANNELYQTLHKIYCVTHDHKVTCVCNMPGRYEHQDCGCQSAQLHTLTFGRSTMMALPNDVLSLSFSDSCVAFIAQLGLQLNHQIISGPLSRRNVDRASRAATHILVASASTSPWWPHFLPHRSICS